MYLHNDKELFEEVVYATANEIGLPVAIIELMLLWFKIKNICSKNNDNVLINDEHIIII